MITIGLLPTKDVSKTYHTSALRLDTRSKSTRTKSHSDIHKVRTRFVTVEQKVRKYKSKL